jgi:hypothetical protein
VQQHSAWPCHWEHGQRTGRLHQQRDDECTQFAQMLGDGGQRVWHGRQLAALCAGHNLLNTVWRDAQPDHGPKNRMQTVTRTSDQQWRWRYSGGAIQQHHLVGDMSPCF